MPYGPLRKDADAAKVLLEVGSTFQLGAERKMVAAGSAASEQTKQPRQPPRLENIPPRDMAP